MAGPNSIDIILFHDENVLQNILSARYPALLCRKLMTVHTLKDNPLPVQKHKTVLHLKSTEAHPDCKYFPDIIIHHPALQPVQMGFLCAPQKRLTYIKGKGVSALLQCCCSFMKLFFSMEKRIFHNSITLYFQLRFHMSGRKVLI